MLQLVAGSTEDRGVGGTAAPPDASGKRVALVIGNSAYASAPLRNPVNDAKAMATALKQCGFEVIDKLDCDLRNMKGAVDDFGARIEGVDAALFFYAGHGLQV
ncbi:MAG: caspase family protein, partial [Candidatus Hydrogenedentes bacterium]|nr:caspase family protein [Candidatus Hydrogenedentota bacterium]